MVERKLMQTMDMIVVKKKRIALIERAAISHKNRHVRGNSASSVWSMLKSVTSGGTAGSERKMLFMLSEFLWHFFFDFGVAESRSADAEGRSHGT